MAIQTIASHQSSGRQYPGLASGLILPEDFNHASGHIQTPSKGIWTPPTGADGYSMQDGILQQDKQVYIPRRTYFLPIQVSVGVRRFAAAANAPSVSAPAPCPPPAIVSRQVGCFNILDDLLLEEQQKTDEQKRDMHWFGRLHEAVVDGINDDRAAMGLPTLQDEAAKRKPDFF